MGDIKHTTLKIWCTNRKEIQDAIHYDVPGLHYHKYSTDGGSLMVKIGGNVDVGKLYERLNKMASIVKIEAVLPDDVKTEKWRYEKNLNNLKQDKQELRSKLEKSREENKNLELKNKSCEEELLRTKKDKENLKLKCEMIRDENKRVEARLTSADEANKKLQRKIKDLEQKPKGRMSSTSYALEVLDDSNRQKAHKHEVQGLKSEISNLKAKLKVSENGRKAGQRELEELKHSRRH